MTNDKLIRGYKAFDKGLTNRYGKEFELGKLYCAEDKIEFGTHGNGFHFCANIEDVLRFFDAMNSEIDICKVIGSGDYVVHEDDYYGYYDMYVSEKIELIKLLSREDILNETNIMYFNRLKRFISGFRLSEEEFLHITDRMEPRQQLELKKTYNYYQK